jgi:hypothetical protein
VASLGPDDRQLLKEALEKRLRKENLEHALGRVLRNHHLDFERYILITTELRDARRGDEDLEAVARRLISGP